MEVAVERPPVKEETSAVAKAKIATIGSSPPIVLESFPSTQTDLSICKQNKRLEATKAEMGEVREENERLKTLLSHIVRDYQSLQTHFLDVVKLQHQPKTPPPPPPLAAVATNAEDADLVSLSLGTTSNGRRKDDKLSSTGEAGHEGLSLGLSCEYDRPCTGDKAASRRPVLNLSSDSSADEGKEDGEPGEPCPPSKASNNLSNSGGDGADDEVLQQQQAKKARVSVRVKCDTPTMNDGCQWRKYGQKISKGNPCPRAYYRCTVAPSCPVRKQVQRCADDMSILITTYEGTHNHPLPPSAAAMASTTSAAATMLTTGASTSSSHHHHPFAPAGAALLGPTTISTATSCPTITLDLTTPHSLLPASFASSTGYESKALPAGWSSGYLAYGSSPYYTKSSPAGHLGIGTGAMAGGMARPGHEQLYQSYLQRATNLGGDGTVAPAVTDTIAKVITSDPSFQSVLAAAITSYMGRGGAQK